MVAILKSGLPEMRPLRAEEIPQVAALEARAYEFPWSEGIFRDCMRAGYNCWALVREEAIIGYGVLSVAAGEAHVLNVCVSPDVQGQGHGRRLMRRLIDLARWFAGEFAEASGHLATLYWPAPVEDNAFLRLTTAGGQVAWLHASWTEWKNLFCFEVFGRDGKLQVDGLGGSYGVERLTLYRLGASPGPPETTTREYAENPPMSICGRCCSARPASAS